MIIYLVCFDLSQSEREQLDQISYWLRFLSSALPLDLPSRPKFPNWSVMLAGLHSEPTEPAKTSSFRKTAITGWKNVHAKLPISHSDGLFSVNLCSGESLKLMRSSLETECRRLFDENRTVVPTQFRRFWESIQKSTEDEVFVSIAEIQERHADLVEDGKFDLAIRYLIALGLLIRIDDKFVCPSAKVKLIFFCDSLLIFLFSVARSFCGAVPFPSVQSPPIKKWNCHLVLANSFFFCCFMNPMEKDLKTNQPCV